jgi:hypothetical protein
MKIVQDIVRFNNIQNKMLPSDFRSNDTVQKRLVEEFSELDINLNYSGARRGGASDIIGRDPNLISSDTVAQSLMAFHGQRDIAYRYKGRIWEENSNYSKVFNDQTTALHIIFVYSLHTAINEIFHNLKSIERQNMTNTQEDQFEFFTKRGSVYILIFAIGQCIETLLGGKVTNKFRLKFLETRGLEEYKEMWKEVIPVILSFSSKLSESVQKYSFTMEDVNKSVNTINQSLDALLNLNKENFKSIYNSFSSKVVR